MSSPIQHDPPGQEKKNRHDFSIFNVEIKKDPESLFCDAGFLEKFMRRKPALAEICEEP